MARINNGILEYKGRDIYWREDSCSCTRIHNSKHIIVMQDPDDEVLDEKEREEFIKLVEKMQEELKNKYQRPYVIDENGGIFDPNTFGPSLPKSYCTCKKLIDGCGCGGGKKEIEQKKKIKKEYGISPIEKPASSLEEDLRINDRH